MTTPEIQPTARPHRSGVMFTPRRLAFRNYVFVLTASIVFFFACGPVQAQASPTSDQPSPWWMRGWEGEVPARQISASATSSLTPRLANESDPDTWTKLVFQSYSQGSWDIKISSNSETDLSTLVAHPAADIRPRFGWEANQVVFVSDRDGNWEIYLINADGTGLRRLTQNGATDTMPSWSPDGSRIVFSSNRSGQYQIYTMKPDGSDVVQLTFLPKDQVSPSWSKDNRIAWSQADQTTGILWIMNGDGSNQHAITPELPYLTNPIWSQDNVQLAFSYAAQNDGAYDVATIADNGSGMKLVAGSDRPTVDFIPTDWDMTPGESWYRILITRIEELDGRLWVKSLEVLQGGNMREMFYAPGNGYVDFEVADRTPPVSQIDPLPALTRAGGYNVKWSVRDIGPSGLWKTELQSRVLPDGAWESSNYYSLDPHYAYLLGQSGTSVAFRARAFDNAGNVEAWPPGDQAEAQTSFYARKLTGQITDGRGTPLYWTPVNITPTPVSTVQTDRQGMFAAGVNATGKHILQFDTGNGSDDPLFSFPIEADRAIRLYTPPRDNIIVNGDFEASGQTTGKDLDAWQSPYDQDHATRLSHLGSQGAQLGGGCDPVLCKEGIQPESIGYTLFAQMDRQDNLHVVWSDGYPGPWHYKQIGADGVSGAVHDLTTTGLVFALLIDNHDTLHLLTIENYAVIHYSLSRNAAWFNHGAVTNIVVTESYLAAAMGPGDVIHLVYSSYEGVFPASNIWYQRIETTGVPSARELVSPLPFGEPMLDVTVSGDGTVHLLHSEANGTTFYYRIRSNEGVWHEAEHPMLAGNNQIIQDFWVDRTNQIHLLWLNGGDSSARYAVRDTNDQWSQYTMVSESVQSLVHAEDRSGGMHLVGCQYNTYPLNDPFAVYQQLRPDGTSTDSLAFRDLELGYLPCYGGLLFFDSSNRPHFLWNFRHSGRAGLWIHSTPGNATTSGIVDTLSQVVTIPTDMHSPTLSFFYQVWFARSAESAGSHLSVAVTDAVAETEIFSATEALDWTLGWADLSHWAGETVTVTFVVDQAVGEPNLRAFVDDVALGSWLTPAIYDVTPGQIDTGDATTFRVVGVNFVQPITIRTMLGEQEIPVNRMNWIDESTLEIDLPALGPGLYDLWVTSSGGRQSVHVGAIRVGRQAYLPLLAR